MFRYNQGFLKFGPMEQCNDGEWIKYEDYVKLDKENRDRWMHWAKEKSISEKNAWDYAFEAESNYFTYLTCAILSCAVNIVLGLILCHITGLF